MYGRIENNKLIYAPNNFKILDKLIINFNKNIILMNQYGFKEIIDKKPNCKENQILIVDSYTETDNTIIINYEIKERKVEKTIEEILQELEEQQLDNMEVNIDQEARISLLELGLGGGE